MWSLAESVSPRVVDVPHTGSTNADLVPQAPAWRHLGVLLTRDQRGGRGRLDRAWQTAPGTALAISVVLKVGRIPVARRGWIPLISGTAMAEAVSAQLPAAGVKWPNDVLVDGRKICGILAEVADPDTVVVGSGVNTRMTAEQMPVPTATSFAAKGVDVDEDRLLADYLRRLGELVAQLERGSVRDIVREHCITIGQEVTAHLPGGDALVGTAVDLDEHGRIVIDAGERHALSAGDIVHLRRA
ncbi:biotin--[acetyl-CoA-carboxylase] ligase [Microbacterium sp. G2-8]|uniref:biotin--[acetyl-CoA-carboxylase] ligase n=1 Tax=Microbacterium sp. G2-8 TaxID=2842454 RepID=UPI001C898A0A|nr:biotin--[acetyl-CoA-carboxylase] ligase [Microbacterium sp. G2-8]